MILKANFGKIMLASFLMIFLIINGIASVQAKNFEVSSVLVKVSLTEDSSVVKKLTVTSDVGGQFNVISNVKGLRLGENNFVLGEGESNTLDLVFDSFGLGGGVYAGSVKVSSSGQEIAVPVIFEVESKDLLFDSNLDVPSQYQKITPDGKIVAQIKIFDLTSAITSEGLGNAKVDVDYKVYSADGGDEISSDSESIVVDKTAQLTKTIRFANGIKEGDYIFSVITKYKTSIGVSSYLFEVSGEVEPNQAPFFREFNWEFTSILGLILFLFIAMIFLFVYLLKDRDKLIAEMQKFNALELRKQRELLIEQAGVARRNKIASPDVIKRDMNRKIKVLRGVHEKRINELRQLNKKGDKKMMIKKMDEWKSKGYNISPLQYKMNSLSKKEMGKIIRGWKEKGYKLK